MEYVNAGLMYSDFKVGKSRFGWSMRPSDVSAFPTRPDGKPDVRVVTLSGGFRLFKWTAGASPESAAYGVTPWWSPVAPYREDKDGAVGRFQQAKQQKTDMSSMVRFMSAVCIDWNDLDNYIEVAIRQGVQVCAFWGKFAPQYKIAGLAVGPLTKEHTEREARVGGVMPYELGGTDAKFNPTGRSAWQFYIPGLWDKHIQRGSVLPAHDMVTLRMHFLGA
jgi:hypothetical protein